MPVTRGAQPFPIIEAFGYSVDAKSKPARNAKKERLCPFAETACEKFKQYGYGYCAVTYSADDDQGIRRSYAVCDHRLDGAPVLHAIRDHFKDRASRVRLIPEIVLHKPRRSFDFVAVTTTGSDIDDVIAIETQAIDIRGGGVGPAWQAWFEGKPEQWRERFSEEAARKGRKDTVAYGVNMANIYKRLGLQVAEKGTFLKRIGVPFYVVMQDRPFQYLRTRIAFQETPTQWDITFITFDYTGEGNAEGALEFKHMTTSRTTLDAYMAALSFAELPDDNLRGHFLERVKSKAGL